MDIEQFMQGYKAAWEGREELGRVHAEGRNFGLAAQKSAAAGIPWHKAAEAFWTAQGAKLA